MQAGVTGDRPGLEYAIEVGPICFQPLADDSKPIAPALIPYGLSFDRRGARGTTAYAGYCARRCPWLIQITLFAAKVVLNAMKVQCGQNTAVSY